ncbi:MAG: DinB family protein [Candidatus Thorarchaeota archaeon]
MDAVEFIRSLAASTREWRERALQYLQEEGCNDLAYRPKSGMSSIGWLLAHQGAAYDYVLNILISGRQPKNPDLFFSYRGDSNDPGDWSGTSLQEINEYFDTVESDFLTWLEHAADDELNRMLEGPETPQYFRGKRVIDAVADMFAHLNHHNGHLNAIKGDWYQQKGNLQS